MNLFDRICRAQLLWSVVVVLAGVVGLVISRDLPWDSAQGTSSGWPKFELYLMTYNRLSALVTIVLGVVGLVAALTRRPALGWIPGVGFAALTVQALVQWREGATTNLLASSGQSLSFAFASLCVYGVTAWLGGQTLSEAKSPPTPDPQESS